MVPPRVVRRLVFTPLLFLLTALVVVLFPAAYLVTSLIGRERRRARRLLWFALAWGTRESAAVVECGWLWLRGRARDDRHYDVIRRYIAGLYSMAQRQLGLRVQIDGSWDGPDGDRPLIVLSRHAGPGDALLLVHHLLSDYRRRPRVVMKAQLRLDPCIDIAAGRMPNVFVTPGGGAVEDIGRLASDLGPRDALLIFPEGGNFTPERRRRAIRRLVRLRRRDEAARAAAMPHLMPPRPGGVLAALDAAPSADVVFVAHCGLDRMTTAGEIWRRVPLTGVVRARWWRVPARDVPGDRDARVGWLYDQWERADAWISSQQEPAPK
ncbi:1-acyl-sn-glycerol-3-phosphate acyltransferase [Actinomadura madurae]|uniref:1-acyl-sn-glycerol-3-phosphate acyltransferase n=1 Tax=Actinomadura madurae TaxID=1993 RepID=UPI0020268C89|nr:1-acyl-sn-glycerol-3-phosphate acyltransferase [Actinomadura madurae]MCP9951496.1 1-acyl-sn-glycerol-3-phosphate acyltransferase [Actinomadura madurae]MCP9980735.1 1-acyl-sn-glycerol-3-phosphate acyltransferase [Actinomadura madurae]MCQ0007761.1 1-acyl-sn-glycerol-3-phosphate acyltransferase [Actinomadura madurae]MCQ0016929.1 1-acyl-sn-glycerol-3-phosphate acyltransferase [Actinomadura madurae]URN07770.1 1-acyl-sn-glycerol-3-phosphate acyltransferase [Actinomadura madurae]